MACCLPILSGILPRPKNDKLLIDVRGGGDTDTIENEGASMTGFLGWFGGGGAKLSEQVAQLAKLPVEGPYEAHYRIWYDKGLLCFKPKSLGGSGTIPAARKFDEILDAAAASTNGETTTGTDTMDSPSSSGESTSNRGHDWSKQTSVESQSQGDGRSLHSFWEERSHTTTMATPESINALKVVQVDR
jgi:hypothetical protein